MEKNRTLHKWSQRDANILHAYLALLVAGAFYRPLFLAALVLAVVLGAAFGVRYARRRRRWEEQPPGEFWIERIKD